MNWMTLLMNAQATLKLAPADNDDGDGAVTPDNGADVTDDDDGGETDDDDDDGDNDDSDLGSGAQKRIRQLNERMKSAEARAKKLEAQLESQKRLSGDDGRALLAAAEASGIMPGLMTTDEAKAFQDLNELPEILERYQDWLDDHESGDELEMGDGITLSYGDVRKRVRKLSVRLEDLRERYGERRRKLKADVKELFELGLAAKKAGWKPGQKSPAKPQKKPVREDRPTERTPPAPKTHRARPEDFDVQNEDDLEAFIAAENRNARKRA